MKRTNRGPRVSEADHIVAFFTVQTALDHLRANVDYKNGQTAIEAFGVLARSASETVEERDNLRRKVEFIQRAYEKSKTGNPNDQDEQYRNLLAFAVAVRAVLND